MKSLAWLAVWMIPAAFAQNWVAGTGALPPLAAQAGYDLGSVPLYICRTVTPQGDTFVGKYSANLGCVYYRGGAVAPSSYQVLADYSIDWRPAANGTVPSGSYPAGGGVYICRAYVENSLQVGQVVSGSPGCEIEFGQTGGYFATYEVMYSPWIPASNGAIPSGAFQGGTDTDGQPLYVCRGLSSGVQHLGKLKPGATVCRAGTGNTPLSFNSYDVLTNFSGAWQTYTNTVPSGGAYFAASGGGAAKYVCRFNVQGTSGLTPGQTGGADSLNKCNIQFDTGVKDSGTFQALRQQETQTVCTYTASPTSINAPAAGSAVTITLTGGCGWANFPSASWLRPDKRTGIAGSFVLNVDPNPSASARTGTVIVGGVTINVSQPGSCSYTLSTASITQGPSAGTRSIGVTTTAGCSWSANTANSWIHLTNSSGTGNGSLILSIDANPGPSTRNGSVLINGQAVTVIQTGVCNYTVSPQTVAMGPEASTFQLNPASNPGCAATATAPAWITITQGPVAGGFTVSVQANSAYATRIGSIVVSTGQTVTITQTGPPCAITASAVAVPRTGGYIGIPIALPNAGCLWSASVVAPHLHLINSSGQGTGVLYVNVDPYTGTSRQGSISLAAYQVITSVAVTQSDAACNFSVSPPAQVPAESGTATVTVSGGAGCQATFSYGEPWLLSPTVVNGPGSYAFTVQANPTFASRSQTVTLGPASFTLTQRGQPCTISTSNPPAVSASGGGFSINVTVPSPTCQWTATETSTFAQLNAPFSGSGNGQLTGTLSANPSNSARAATISFTSYLTSTTATVNQNGTTCNYTVAPLTIQAAAQGGPQTINVTAPGGCSWTAIAADTSWLSFPSTNSGTGSGSFSLQIAPNPGGATRATSVSVAGQSISITQAAAVCTYTLSATGISAPATGSSGAVNVTTPAGCPWSVTSPDSWIVISSALNNSGPGVIAFSVLANTSASQRVSNLTIAGKLYTITQSGSLIGNSTAGLTFVALPPCRVLETREIYNFEGRTGSFGPPYLNAAETRTVPLPSSTLCSIPATAKAYVMNITLVPRGAVDFVTVWPAGDSRPNVWSIRSPDGNIVANSAIVKAGVNGAISLYTSSNTDLLIDVTGYFTDSAVTSLVYYPITPCRVIETRQDYRPAGPFGAPSLSSRQTRSFRFPDYVPCGLPAGIAAYSMTITAVPKGPLQFLTAWPFGFAQPNVSSINSPAGRVLANSVILPPSSDGSINVYAFDATDFLVDVNGYFAPDDGVNGQFYYPVTQCRASDSTASGGIYNDDSSRTIDVPAAPGCSGIPASARGYALNVTALPSGSPMPFLTAWPSGQNRPNASILNAFEGQIVSNSAIIPAGGGGKIDLYAFRRTHVVLEISGYFGR